MFGFRNEKKSRLIFIFHRINLINTDIFHNHFNTTNIMVRTKTAARKGFKGQISKRQTDESKAPRKSQPTEAGVKVRKVHRFHPGTVGKIV